MQFIRRLLIALAGLSLIGAVRSEPLVYTLSPEIRGGQLSALDVTIQMRAGPDGRLALDLPGAGGAAVELWRYIDDLKVEGAKAVRAPTPAERLIEAEPGAPVTVRYRVVSAFDHDPDIKELET